jgi:hypothetical protein
MATSLLPDKRTEDRLERVVKVETHVSVPDAYDPEAFLLEPSRSLSVALFFCAVSVLTAIDLDDEPSLETDEIDDERSDRMLSAEPVAGKPLVPQLLPDDPLLLRGIAPELPRSLVCHAEFS